MDGITIPSETPYLISNSHKRLLEIIDRLAQRGQVVNVLVRGPAGCGKSELVTQFAARTKRPLAVLEVGQLGDPRQIFGYHELKDGETHFVKGLFTEAITTPGCVVHLQELNRPESDKALNAIFSVLDNLFRRIWLDEVGYISVAPGVVFFATLNEGYEFIGTLPLDAALEDRFPFKIRLSYLPPDYETSLIVMRVGLDATTAREIVEVANRLRTNSNPIHVSTRAILDIATLRKEGLALEEALRATIATDDDTLESVLLGLHLGGHKVESSTPTYELL